MSEGQAELKQVAISPTGTPAASSLETLINAIQSGGILTGLVISDGGSGTVDIASGTVVLKKTDSNTGAITIYDFAGASGVSLTDNSINWVYIDYNAGSPTHGVTTDWTTLDLHTQVIIGKVYRDGTVVHIEITAQELDDFSRRLMQYRYEVDGLHRVSGCRTSETGTRNIAVTAGALYSALTRIATAAIDTSAADDFTYQYRDGVGGWTDVTAQTQINNTNYDDGDGTLGTLTANRYGVHWVYLHSDGDLYVQYGQGDYTLAQAEIAPVPVSSDINSEMGVLIAKIIIQKSASTFTEIQIPFDTVFQAGTVGDHNDLSSLQGGTSTQRYHLTSAEHVELTSRVVLPSEDLVAILNGITSNTILDLAEGTHTIASQVTGLSNKTNITIRGTKASIVDVTYAAGVPFLLTAPLTDISFEGFVVNFDPASGGYDLFSLVGAAGADHTRISFHDVTVTCDAAAGLNTLIRQPSSASCDIYGLSVRGCTFVSSTCGSAVFLEPQSSRLARDIVISACTFIHTNPTGSWAAVLLAPGVSGTLENATVDNCSCRGWTEFAGGFPNGAGSVVRNVSFTDNVTVDTGIGSPNEVMWASGTGTLENVTIASNTMKNHNGLDYIGVAGNRMIIVGNVIDGGTAAPGINVSGTDCTVVGNTVANCASDGIVVSGSRNLVDANVIYNNGGYGINETAGSGNLYGPNNRVYGNTSGSYSFAGTSRGVVRYIYPYEDAVAILNAAQSNSHYILTEGTHTFASTVILNGLTNVSIRGENAIISCTLTASMLHLFALVGCTNVEIGGGITVVSSTSLYPNYIFLLEDDSVAQYPAIGIQPDTATTAQSLGNYSGTYIDKIAQSFTLSGSETVMAVEMWTKRVGTPGTITARIETDSSGSPSGVLAHANAYATFPNPSTSLDLTKVLLTGDSALTGPGTFWLVLQLAGDPGSGNYVELYEDSGSSYAGGSYKYNSGGWQVGSDITDAGFAVIKDSTLTKIRLHNIRCTTTDVSPLLIFAGHYESCIALNDFEISDVTLEDNYLSLWLNEYFSDAAYTVDDWRILRNHCTQTAGSGGVGGVRLKQDTTAVASRVQVVGNSFDNFVYGISINYCENSQINGNYVRTPSGTDNTNALSFSMLNGQVIGNRIIQRNSHAIARALWVNGRNVTVSGNYITQSGLAANPTAIYVVGGGDNIITDNTLEDGPNNGIHLDGTESNIVANNRVDTFTGYGVQEDADCSDNDIANNYAKDCTAGPYNLLGASHKNVESIVVACSDEVTPLTTGTAKVTFRMPFPFYLAELPRASVTTAPTGSVLTVDINEGGTTILSTKLTIDATEKTSTTAATPAVLSDRRLADDAEITIDIDGVGSTIAGAGLKVALIGYKE